jgi:peptidoglycan hydrolase CwlO-like protein
VVGGVPLLIMKGGISMPIAVIISIISVAFSVFFGFFSLSFNFKNDKKANSSEFEERVRENTRINLKLDEISSNTTEIKKEVTEMRRELNSHDSRIVKVEESTKQAHHRIDELVKRFEDKEV